MIWVLVGLVAVVILALTVWWMLRAASAQGGQRPGDAAGAALQVLAQAEAFRGGDSERRVAWDGVGRLSGVEGNDGGA